MLGLIVHSTKGASCMREVTAVVSNLKGHNLSMAAIREYTGNRWELHEISSVLAKLVNAGVVVEGEETTDKAGKRKRKTWRWL